MKYKGKNIGNHRIDLLVEDKVIVELKATDAINRIYGAQFFSVYSVVNCRF